MQMADNHLQPFDVFLARHRTYFRLDLAMMLAEIRVPFAKSGFTRVSGFVSIRPVERARQREPVYHHDGLTTMMVLVDHTDNDSRDLQTKLRDAQHRITKAATLERNALLVDLSVRGNAFPRFLASKAMADSLGAELRQKLSQPLKFQWSGPGAQPPSERTT